MNRRTVLRRSGALAAVGLAGCFGNGGDGTPGNENGSPGTESGSPSDRPQIVDRRIETRGSGCETGETGAATVYSDPDAGLVVVAGSIWASTPCHLAALESVRYDAEADELAVSVVPEDDPEDEGCVTCTGAIDYRAVIDLEGSLPGETTVTHDGESVDLTQGEPIEIVDTTVELSGAGHDGSESVDDITFDRDENTVSVTGTIEGSDGCTTAELGEVSYDLRADEVGIDVVTTDREDCEAGTDSLVYIDYEVTVAFEPGVPRSASVAHDGQGLASAAHASESAAAAPPKTTEKPPDAQGPGTEGEPLN